MFFGKKNRTWIFLGIVVSVFLFSPGTSQAFRYHIKSTGTRTSGPSIPNNWSDPNCFPTIASGAAVAAHEDTILLFREVLVLDQSVQLTSYLGNQDMNANPENVCIDLRSQGRFVFHGSFTRLVIQGITFQGDGNSSQFAALEINNSGGMLQQSIIQNCKFLSLNNSDQNSTLAGGGAGIRADGDGNEAAINIRNCQFINNRCRGGGGALFFGDNYQGYISDSEFINNKSENGVQSWDGRGGAIYIRSNNAKSNLVIVDCLFQENSSRGPGGAIFVEGADLFLVATDILDCRSAFEGSTSWSAGAGLFMRGVGGHNQDLRLEMWGCAIRGNLGNLTTGNSAGDGGGVLVKGISGQMVDVFISECSFEENFNAQGAGLYIGRFTNGEVDRCSFRNNTAYFHGGGSYKGGAFSENLGETVEYNYCEFVGNRAGYNADGSEASVISRGGGFCTRLFPRAFFNNCTFLNNHVSSFSGQSDAIYMWRDGGQFDSELKRMKLINCLFYGNNAQDIQVRVQENGFELVSHCAFASDQFDTPSVEPVALVILDSNPCASETDISLIAGSNCIDAAMPIGLTEDFSGCPVPQGDAPDIGAWEYPRPAPVLNPAAENFSSHIHSAKVWPNPFNPKTQISFFLDNPQIIDLVIFDLKGATVRHLFRGYLEAGPQAFTWNGHDDSGRSLASGIYHGVIIGNGQKTVTKMVLIR